MHSEMMPPLRLQNRFADGAAGSIFLNRKPPDQLHINKEFAGHLLDSFDASQPEETSQGTETPFRSVNTKLKKSIKLCDGVKQTMSNGSCKDQNRNDDDRNDDVFETFNDSCSTHFVASTLETLEDQLRKTDGAADALTEAIRRALRMHLLEIIDTISPDDIVDRLMTQDDSDTIRASWTNRDRATKLMQILLTRGENCLIKFMEILQYQYPHVYKEVIMTKSKNPQQDHENENQLDRRKDGQKFENKGSWNSDTVVSETSACPQNEFKSLCGQFGTEIEIDHENDSTTNNFKKDNTSAHCIITDDNQLKRGENYIKHDKSQIRSDESQTKPAENQINPGEIQNSHYENRTMSDENQSSAAENHNKPDEDQIKQCENVFSPDVTLNELDEYQAQPHENKNRPDENKIRPDEHQNKHNGIQIRPGKNQINHDEFFTYADGKSYGSYRYIRLNENHTSPVEDLNNVNENHDQPDEILFKPEEKEIESKGRHDNKLGGHQGNGHIGSGFRCVIGKFKVNRDKLSNLLLDMQDEEKCKSAQCRPNAGRRISSERAHSVERRPDYLRSDETNLKTPASYRYNTEQTSVKTSNGAFSIVLHYTGNRRSHLPPTGGNSHQAQSNGSTSITLPAAPDTGTLPKHSVYSETSAWWRSLVQRADARFNCTVFPPKPKGPLQADSIGCNSINMSWGKLVREDEAMIDKYVVEYRNARETHWVTVGTTSNHDFVVDGLQENTDYLFRVFSVNGAEKSEILESVLITTRRRKAMVYLSYIRLWIAVQLGMTDIRWQPTFKKHYRARFTRCVLLYGPPGCGKTMIAKATAKAADPLWNRLYRILQKKADAEDDHVLDLSQQKACCLAYSEKLKNALCKCLNIIGQGKDRKKLHTDGGKIVSSVKQTKTKHVLEDEKHCAYHICNTPPCLCFDCFVSEIICVLQCATKVQCLPGLGYSSDQLSVYRATDQGYSAKGKQVKIAELGAVIVSPCDLITGSMCLDELTCTSETSMTVHEETHDIDELLAYPFHTALELPEIIGHCSVSHSKEDGYCVYRSDEIPTALELPEIIGHCSVSHSKEDGYCVYRSDEIQGIRSYILIVSSAFEAGEKIKSILKCHNKEIGSDVKYLQANSEIVDQQEIIQSKPENDKRSLYRDSLLSDLFGQFQMKNLCSEIDKLARKVNKLLEELCSLLKGERDFNNPLKRGVKLHEKNMEPKGSSFGVLKHRNHMRNIKKKHLKTQQETAKQPIPHQEPMLSVCEKSQIVNKLVKISSKMPDARRCQQTLIKVFCSDPFMRKELMKCMRMKRDIRNFELTRLLIFRLRAPQLMVQERNLRIFVDQPVFNTILQAMFSGHNKHGAFRRHSQTKPFGHVDAGQKSGLRAFEEKILKKDEFDEEKFRKVSNDALIANTLLVLQQKYNSLKSDQSVNTEECMVKEDSVIELYEPGCFIHSEEIKSISVKACDSKETETKIVGRNAENEWLYVPRKKVKGSVVASVPTEDENTIVLQSEKSSSNHMTNEANEGTFCDIAEDHGTFEEDADLLPEPSSLLFPYDAVPQKAEQRHVKILQVIPPRRSETNEKIGNMCRYYLPSQVRSSSTSNSLPLKPWKSHASKGAYTEDDLKRFIRDHAWLPLDKLPAPSVDQTTFTIANVIGQHMDPIFKRMAKGETINPAETMKFELLRLCTFRNYPKQNKPYLIRLAGAGFYYAADGDEVVCYCCGVRRHGWTEDDKPDVVHKRLSPRCSFLVRNAEVNFLVPKFRPGETSKYAYLEEFIAPDREDGEDFINDNGHIYRQYRFHSSDPPVVEPTNNSTTNSSSLGINTETPKHPHYAVKTTRRNSYAGWPESSHQDPDVLAEAGFYYAGMGDCVRCFFCGVGLRHWAEEDNPWIEHARWGQTCQYLKQYKGEEFINLVQMAVQITRDEQTGTPGGQSGEEISSVLMTDAAQSVIEMGYETRIIRRAIDILMGQTGRNGVTAERLMEKVLELEEAETAQREHGEQKTPQTRQDTAAASNDPNPTAANASAPTAVSRQARVQSGTSGNTGKKDKTNGAETNSLQAKNPTSTTSGASADGDPKKIKAENEKLKEQTLCKICMDKTVSIVFLPCGHLVTCAECAPALRKCPICRALVKGTVKTYMS